MMKNKIGTGKIISSKSEKKTPRSEKNTPKNEKNSTPVKVKKVVGLDVNIGLQASITPVGLEFGKNFLVLGESHCRIYGIVKFPGEVDYGWLSRLTNIPGTIVSIGYSPVDNGEVLNTLNTNIKTLRVDMQTAKNPQEQMRKNKAVIDAEKILEQIDLNNEIISSFSIVIMVMSRSENDFKEKCARTESIAGTMGCKLRILNNLQKEAFQHISPSYPTVKTISDITSRPFLNSTFVGGFPFANSGFTDETGYYLAKNSDGGIVLFDPWIRDSNRVNSNITIFGSSGMGKSTLMKHILFSERARGAKIIIIDPEGEYKELCQSEYINGSWVDVAGGRGGLINPLQIRPVPPDDEEENANKDETVQKGIGNLAVHLKTLETFFSLYRRELTEMHRAILEGILIELYAEFGITWDTDVENFKNDQYPTMTDLHKLIYKKSKNAVEHKNIFDDLTLLLNSAANGADKALWNGHSTISADSGFICLDTKSITNLSGNILSAQYFNVLSWCWEQISRDRSERVLLVADEAWMMIDPKCPQSLEFLRMAEKRARKYEGAIMVSTQSIVDFLDPAVKLAGQAVLDMPAVKFIFGADGESLNDVKSVFSLNDAQYRFVESKKRAQALMKVGSQTFKVRFDFSDDRLAMFGKRGGR
jgi:hypothetical protein